MSATSDQDQDQEIKKRQVTILMTPVKHRSPLMSLLIRCIRILLGSNAALGWAMHWMIRVDSTCFELKRYKMMPYTRLALANWDPSRDDIVMDPLSVGLTTWTDTEIMDHSTQYFEREANMYYDLYMNNCQTYVLTIAQQICADSIPKDRLLSVTLTHMISYTLSRLVLIIMLPIYKLYYSLKGCDRVVISEYEIVMRFWTYWILPAVLHTPIASLSHLHKMFQDLVEDKSTIESATIRYCSAIVTSGMMFTNLWVVPLSVIHGTQPRPFRHIVDGKWKLRERPRRLQLVNLDGSGVSRDLGIELGAETPVQDDSETVIEGDNRWRNHKDQKIPEWAWIIGASCGITMAVWYWILILEFWILVNARRLIFPVQ